MSLKDIVVNYEDIDPISLEKIQDLPLSKIFYVTNKKTKKKYAYDAVNWFIHISNDRKHPITRQKLSKSEIWDLYLITIKQYNFITDIELLEMLNKSLQKYHSNKIVLKKDSINSNLVKLFSESPLFNVKIKKLLKQNNDNKEVSNFKTYDLVYSLLDSRDMNVVFKNLRATIQLPLTMKIMFSY